MSTRRFCRLLLCTALVSGCEAMTEASDSIARRGSEAAAAAGSQRGGVFIEPAPYFGDKVAVIQGSSRGKPLPRELEGARSFTATLERASIATVAEVLTEKTGLPVNIRTRYTLPDGTLVEIPIGGRLSTRHEGALSAFLDKVAARMDVAWSFDGTAITFDRMETRTWSLPLPTGSASFETSLSGIAGAGAGRSAELTRSSVQDPWAELEAQLAPVAPSPAYVTLARGLGRVSVFGPPSVQAKAALIIDDFHRVFSTRIGLEVALYFVDAERSDDFEAGLAVSGPSGSFLGTTGTLSGNGVATLARGDVTASFRALSRDRSVVDYRLGSTVAQSGVVAPIVLTRAQNYVASTTTTTEGGAVSTSIETATVDTGVSIHALPRLVEGNRIQLSLTIFQNDLTALEEFTSGSSTIQLPTIDQRAIQNDSVLAPGETLVLSGYEQEVASRSASGSGSARFLGLGGRQEGQVRKIRMIVLVRPTLMPVGASR